MGRLGVRGVRGGLGLRASMTPRMLVYLFLPLGPTLVVGTSSSVLFVQTQREENTFYSPISTPKPRVEMTVFKTPAILSMTGVRTWHV